MVGAKVVVRALHPVREKGQERYRQVGSTYVESLVEGVTAVALEKRILRQLELNVTQFSGFLYARSNRVTLARRGDGIKEEGLFSILGPEDAENSYAEDVEDGDSGADLDPGQDNYESVALCTALEYAMSWIRHKVRPEMCDSKLIYVWKSSLCPLRCAVHAVEGPCEEILVQLLNKLDARKSPIQKTRPATAR
jgi:hypothetical protein